MYLMYLLPIRIWRSWLIQWLMNMSSCKLVIHRYHQPSQLMYQMIQNGSSCPVSIDQDAPTASHSSTSSYFQSPPVHQGTAVDDSFEVNSFPPPNDVPFDNTLAPEFSSKAYSSGDLDRATSVPNPQPHEQYCKMEQR